MPIPNKIVLGPKAWTPSTFQPWLRPWLDLTTRVTKFLTTLSSCSWFAWLESC